MKNGFYINKILRLILIGLFVVYSVISPSQISAQNVLPTLQSALLRGLIIRPEHPLEFEFIIEPGKLKDDQPKLLKESEKFVQYFLAALAVPEDQLWVNLSPHERNRIIPEKFGLTMMGRDLLDQDYQLKQLTSSLLSPENELGKQFWGELREKFSHEFSSEEVNIETFHRIWIVPDFATVYVHENNVFVADHRFKVLLEEDYVSLEKQSLGDIKLDKQTEVSQAANEAFKRIILPEIEKQVNEGEIFIPLRQVFYAMVLGSWYKTNLKGSLVAQLYADQNKVQGIELEDKNASLKVYDEYFKAFQAGAFDHLSEEYDPESQQIVMRKYVSGGFRAGQMDKNTIAVVTDKDYIEARNTGRKILNLVGGVLVALGVSLTSSGVQSASAGDFQDFRSNGLLNQAPTLYTAQEYEEYIRKNPRLDLDLIDKAEALNNSYKEQFLSALGLPGGKSPIEVTIESIDPLLTRNGFGESDKKRGYLLRFTLPFEGDNGMTTESNPDQAIKSTDNNVGGIDLNPANWNLLTEGFQTNYIFQIDKKVIDAINLQGLQPTIINFQPLTNIPQLLGVE